MGRALALLTETPNRIRQKFYGLGTGYYKWIVELEGGKPPSRRIAAKILRILGCGYNSRRHVERLEVQDDICLKVFRIEEGATRGPGASLFVKGEEVLRFACLGHGRGYYQVYPNRLKRWDVSRHYFKEKAVDAQIDAAVRLVDCETQERLRASPVSALREVALDVDRLAQACQVLSEKLRAYAH